MTHPRITALFAPLNIAFPSSGLAVTSPSSGEVIAHVAADTGASVAAKIEQAQKAQAAWRELDREQRAQGISAYAAALKSQRETLAEIVSLEGGKTAKEAQAEADGAADILLKTIKDASLPEFGGMLRVKERPPVGIVGLITSFNFPIAVAHWTIAPAMLAANGVVWKPSEKTPLTALACKAIFDAALPAYRDLLQVTVGARDIGEALVASEAVDMISATGSVGMGKGILAALANKKNNAIKPILELGGNNGIILSEQSSPEHVQFAVKSLLTSFFGSTGQRCTNTRRLFVHRSIHDEAVKQLSAQIESFLAGAAMQPDNDYGYGALIDEAAFTLFEQAKKQAAEEGGKILFGRRIEKSSGGFFVAPALALMPKQTAIMHKETFAPLLFIAPYDTFGDALAMVNAPANAGLVNGIYTQSKMEAELFAAKNEAGHSLINSPKGTGTPAFGMGFGGNKDSGCGEILNAADPLRPFTRDTNFSRVAINKDVPMA